MHYSGNVVRPPYEANTVLLEVTVGCSHNACTFCSFYWGDRFRLVPMSQVEEDLEEVCRALPGLERIFLLGADAFVLSYAKLKAVAQKVREYLPRCSTIAMYASINNIKGKSVEQLRDLRGLGVNDITIGVESGDNEVLAAVNKGYTAEDLVEQCHKLDAAGMEYRFLYIGAVAGKGKCEKNALESAVTFNQTQPTQISISQLTLMPGSDLLADARAGRFEEATEYERIREVQILVRDLDINTRIVAEHVSNAVIFRGNLPQDNAAIVASLQDTLDNFDEQAHRRFREQIASL